MSLYYLSFHTNVCLSEIAVTLKYNFKSFIEYFVTKATSSLLVKNSAYLQTTLQATTHVTMTTADVSVYLIGMASTALTSVSLMTMSQDTTCVAARVKKYVAQTGMVVTVL